jgi:predicted O-methyltransferase YrrM
MTSEDPAVVAARRALAGALEDTSAEDLSWIQPPPQDDGWTLAADALCFLARLVRRLKPRHILELGGGLSTRALVRFTQPLDPPCRITSVDHDPEFRFDAEASGDALARGARTRLACQLAPVVARDCGGKLLPVYLWDTGRFASPDPVDLAIVDGPPAALGGREGTLYQIMDAARPGTVAVFDDAQRKEERAAMRHWQESLGDCVEFVSPPRGFAKGLAAAVILRPVPRAALWAEKLARTRREIETVVPSGETVAVIDLGYWEDGLVPTRRQVPFLGYPPVDDREAMAEVDRLRGARCGFLALAWPSFWWLDFYGGLFQHLRQRFATPADHDRLLLFDLRSEIRT